MPAISVIVPVYNIEKYISRCIESIKKQSFEDFELLLIDDGSTDRSGEICDNFAKNDKQIKVFHKNNEGVSSARNLGIQKSEGYLITFVDGDDWIHEQYLECLYLGIQQSNSDIVICGGKEIDEQDNVIRTYSFSNYEVLNWNDSKLYDLPYFTYVIHRMLIRKEIISELEFDISLCNGEDTLYLTEALIRSQKGVCFIPYNGYYYLIRSSGAAQHYKYSIKKFSAIIAYEKRLCIMEQSKIVMQVSWYESFVLEVYRLYNYLILHPVFYREEHAQILFGYLKKYKKFSNVLGQGFKFRLLYYMMLKDRRILEKILRKKELPVPHLMEN